VTFASLCHKLMMNLS